MAALAPAAPSSLLASLPTSPPPAHTTAISSNPSAQPPRLLIRLPEAEASGAHRNPLKRKWRSIVNFFALPIRSYYLEPPGHTYRAELRARRAAGQWWAEDDEQHHCFWPCPAYTDQVGDDEMVLFKAQEEAEALAALQASQQEAAREEEEEELASTAPEMSPDYEAANPLSIPPSNPTPTFENGTPMSRHLSTPLTPTPTSSSPPTRNRWQRSRAQSTAAIRPHLGGRNISEPLSWTLVRSQYSYPKRGLTAEQLSFLSSVESLGRFGVPHSPSAGAVAAGAAMAVPSPAYEASVEERGDYGFPTVQTSV